MKTTSRSPKTEPAPIEKLSYEAAFTALEEVVTALESEKQPLDEALALFERGQLLIQRLSDLLDQAELKVRQLAGEETVDFESDPQA